MGGKVCGSNPLSKSTALLWSCGDSFPFLDGIAMFNPNILQRVKVLIVTTKEVGYTRPSFHPFF